MTVRPGQLWLFCGRWLLVPIAPSQDQHDQGPMRQYWDVFTTGGHARLYWPDPSLVLLEDVT